MRADGLLTQCVAMEHEMERACAQRDDVMRRFLRPQPCLPAPAAVPAASKRVAASLCRNGWALVEDLLPSASHVHMMLRELHTRGDLHLGEVSRGVRQASRSDLMTWLPAHGAQRTELRELLRAVDELVLALMTDRGVADRLGAGVQLQRHEIQATCYPGTGATYPRHLDETGAFATRRVLTCIFYANPQWQQSDGGELRLHVSGGRTLDVQPLANRLILFWSDALPHEVLLSRAHRYAVSIWYHDMRVWKS